MPLASKAQSVRVGLPELAASPSDRLLTDDDPTFQHHLLDIAETPDDGSAVLIYHLILTGMASAVVTVRSGEPTPDPVTALWKDGVAERVEVQGLSRAETTELVEAGLGGPVDGLTAERLWQLSQGNALYLRELVQGGVSTGTLVHTGRVWRWQGSIRAAGRLVELLEARIGNLPATVRQLVELVAFGGPLDIEALQQVGAEPATVETAEAAGLLCSEPAGHRIQLRLAHPLLGEALRARISPLRARAVYVTLTPDRDHPTRRCAAVGGVASQRRDLVRTGSAGGRRNRGAGRFRLPAGRAASANRDRGRWWAGSRAGVG
jgi:hypothetical protein